MIVDLLTLENLKANFFAETWEEAGRAAGQLLIENGGVEPRYIDAVLESIRKFGPYIVVAPGIALFHARPQDGVKKECMSLITLREGVNFNSAGKDPVKIVFAFGALDSGMHIKILTDLMEILKDINLINKIKNSDSEREILNAINLKFRCQNAEG